MPGPWRLLIAVVVGHGSLCFNLRRDARPLATSVSVSWRVEVQAFQSQTRCQAPGDSLAALSACRIGLVSISDEMPGPWRLRRECGNFIAIYVSISDEMPGPWRLEDWKVIGGLRPGFNLRRDARPLATKKDTRC